jgi:hypothetical protein
VFVCDYCRQPIGPKVSPIPVILTRPMTYKVIREVEFIGPVEDFTSGYETIAEFKSCAPCQKLPLPKPQLPVDMTLIRQKAEGFRLHAHKCKVKEGVDCFVCKRSREFYESLPPNVVSLLMQDTPAVAVHVSLATLLIEGAFENSRHNTKRSQRSAKVALDLLGPYAKRVGLSKPPPL